MATAAISRLLIANRGEIAIRIMRTCREMGIDTVAVYGDGEEHARHVEYATDAYRIPDGDGLPYLRMDALIDIAHRSGAQAIHPGYGFLSENAEFARRVTEAHLIFVGPSADVIALMGDKVEARRVAERAQVPLVPGTAEPVDDLDLVREWAESVGYPIAVKAAGGGGGRGFRVARTADNLDDAFAQARGEAERYFANPDVYLERYIERPRHIEVQVFVDNDDDVTTFPERECSIQRRHQKLIEETPSPAVTPEIRAELMKATERLVREVGYRGVGTVEYLMDQDGSFYFLEMNTRIQVEHTVTEMVTSIDVVKEQLHLAMGQPVIFSDLDVASHGWAMECRINAENAGNDFRPELGTISRYVRPAGLGVRTDSSVLQGDAINPNYDSMIAKLVCWGRTRDEVIARMRRSLGDYVIEGVVTTIPFHLRVMDHPAFVAGETSTSFLPDHPELLKPYAVSATAASQDESAELSRSSMLIEVNGRRFDVSVLGDTAVAGSSGSAPKRAAPGRGRRSASAAATDDSIISPGQGTVLRVPVSNGDHVSAGDVICVVEAMKMENELTAHRDGVVSGLSVQPGESVKQGAVIATITDERHDA